MRKWKTSDTVTCVVLLLLILGLHPPDGVAPFSMVGLLAFTALFGVALTLYVIGLCIVGFVVMAISEAIGPWFTIGLAFFFAAIIYKIGMDAAPVLLAIPIVAVTVTGAGLGLLFSYDQLTRLVARRRQD